MATNNRDKVTDPAAYDYWKNVWEQMFPQETTKAEDMDVYTVDSRVTDPEYADDIQRELRGNALAQTLPNVIAGSIMEQAFNDVFADVAYSRANIRENTVSADANAFDVGSYLYSASTTEEEERRKKAAPLFIGGLS